MAAANEKSAATLSLDLDDLWAYLRTRGDRRWQDYPSYLDRAVPRMLRLFKSLNLTITVFVVGRDAEIPRNQDLLSTILNAGHELASHSYEHSVDFHRATAETVNDELERTESAIQVIGGPRPIGFRGPSFRLSETIIETLIQREYRYDASTFPTFAGPLARAYYRAKNPTLGPDRERVRDLFGSFRDGRRPLKPYRWSVGDTSICELPVTTFPLFRMPIHLTYINFLADHSPLLARVYFRSALACCRMFGTTPSLLLHAADFIGSNDDDCPQFLPGMKRSSEEKIAFLHNILLCYAGNFGVTALGSFVENEVSNTELKVLSVSSLH